MTFPVKKRFSAVTRIVDWGNPSFPTDLPARPGFAFEKPHSVDSVANQWAAAGPTRRSLCEHRFEESTLITGGWAVFRAEHGPPEGAVVAGSPTPTLFVCDPSCTAGRAVTARLTRECREASECSMLLSLRGSRKRVENLCFPEIRQTPTECNVQFVQLRLHVNFVGQVCERVKTVESGLWRLCSDG